MISLETIYDMLRENALIILFSGLFSFVGVYLGFSFGRRDLYETFSEETKKLKIEYEDHLKEEVKQVKEESNARLTQIQQSKNSKIKQLEDEYKLKEKELKEQVSKLEQYIRDLKSAYDFKIYKLKVQHSDELKNNKELNEIEKEKLTDFLKHESLEKDAIVKGRDGLNTRLRWQRDTFKVALMIACEGNAKKFDEIYEQAKAQKQRERTIAKIKPPKH